MKQSIVYRTLPFAFLASLAACDSSEPASDAEATPQPAPTVTETVAATPEPTRTPDPEVDAAGAQDESQAREGATQDTIPSRFHGEWAEDLDFCGIPGHQRYDIQAREIGFFESTGVVQNVRVNGDYAAATVSEQYGDAPPAEYVFYMAIEDGDTMRIRYDKEPRFRIYRCP